MTSKWTEYTERALEKETSDSPLYPEAGALVPIRRLTSYNIASKKEYANRAQKKEEKSPFTLEYK